MSAMAGAPVLLKQGYMQTKKLLGWNTRYYRLLQVCLSSQSSPLSPLRWKHRTVCSSSPLMTPRPRPTSFRSVMERLKTPLGWMTSLLVTSDMSEMVFSLQELKLANALRVTTESGKVFVFLCTDSKEHRQWFDAIYYSTTLTRLAEYASPLTGSWLFYMEKGKFQKYWFVIKDSFLLCYEKREDMTMINDGKLTKRKFVLPLNGAVSTLLLFKVFLSRVTSHLNRRCGYMENYEVSSFSPLRARPSCTCGWRWADNSSCIDIDALTYLKVLYTSMGNKIEYTDEREGSNLPAVILIVSALLSLDDIKGHGCNKS
eukprot:271202-Hanusia_phi.AAC.6